MRGYFGIGAERISKPMNLGAILRTAHAFGASFTFALQAHHKARDVELADTSKGAAHLPLYYWDNIESFKLPVGCQVVGVELTEDAITLPSFRHPLRAAYLLGPEKGNLSDKAQSACDYVIKIPTNFCVNVSIAAALVMYDRVLSMGSFPDRPVKTGGPPSQDKWQRVLLK